MNRKRPEAGAEPGERKGLERLLDAERRLDLELAEARSRADEIVASAAAEVARQRDLFAARLAAAQERLRAAIEDDLARQIAAIEEEAERAEETERRLARFRSAAGELDKLAARVARRVVRDTLGSTAGPSREVPP